MEGSADVKVMVSAETVRMLCDL